MASPSAVSDETRGHRTRDILHPSHEAEQARRKSIRTRGRAEIGARRSRYRAVLREDDASTPTLQNLSKAIVASPRSVAARV